MLLDLLVFAGCQRTGLVQQPVGERELADVVQQRRGLNGMEQLRVRDGGLRGERPRVMPNALGVLVRCAVARLDRAHEGYEDNICKT